MSCGLLPSSYLNVLNIKSKMATKVIKGVGKNTIVLQTYDNFLFPMVFYGNVPEQLQKIKNIPCWEDDVFVSTYPKSGTHWIYNIVYMLQNNTTTLYGTPFFLDLENLDNISEKPSPRVFASHLPYHYLPEDLRLKRGKNIVVYRNPKDVCVSTYTYFDTMNRKMNPYRGDWDGFIDLFLNGYCMYDSWFKWIKVWESVRTTHSREILFLRYEDIVNDLRGHIQKIADYIGVQVNPELFETIVNSSTFRHMKKEWKAEDIHWFKEQKSAPIYRKGEIGDWKNWFTQEQSDRFDAVYKKEMADCSIDFQFTKSKL